MPSQQRGKDYHRYFPDKSSLSTTRRARSGSCEATFRDKPEYHRLPSHAREGKRSLPSDTIPLSCRASSEGKTTTDTFLINLAYQRPAGREAVVAKQLFVISLSIIVCRATRGKVNAVYPVIRSRYHAEPAARERLPQILS